MPVPHENESHGEYMKRCQGMGHSEKECQMFWEEKHPPMKDAMPMPEPDESESEYMTRCQDEGHSKSECQMMWQKEGMMDRKPSGTIKANIRNDGSTEILVYGVIGEDFFFDGITAKAFRSEIKKVKGKLLNLRINSEGGSVTEAAAMLNALDEFKGRIEVDIDGLAASAASFLAMAGDVVRVATNGLVMVHDPMAGVMGRADDMRRTADLLDKVREQIIDAYERKSKAGREQIGAWMAAETWFTGKEAVDAGLADTVTEPLRVAACADPKVLAKLGYKHVPPAVLKNNAAEAKRLAEETKRRLEIAARL